MPESLLVDYHLHSALIQMSDNNRKNAFIPSRNNTSLIKFKIPAIVICCDTFWSCCCCCCWALAFGLVDWLLLPALAPLFSTVLIWRAPSFDWVIVTVDAPDVLVLLFELLVTVVCCCCCCCWPPGLNKVVVPICDRLAICTVWICPLALIICAYCCCWGTCQLMGGGGGNRYSLNNLTILRVIRYLQRRQNLHLGAGLHQAGNAARNHLNG